MELQCIISAGDDYTPSTSNFHIGSIESHLHTVMSTNPPHDGGDEPYFEDDAEYDGYPGCSSSAPPVSDPLLLLSPERLDGRYEGSWPTHDELVIRGVPNPDTPAMGYINARRVPLRKRTDLYEYADALSYLPGVRTRRLPYLDLACPHCSSGLISVHRAHGVSRWDDEDDYVEVNRPGFCRGSIV